MPHYHPVIAAGREPKRNSSTFNNNEEEVEAFIADVRRQFDSQQAVKQFS